MKAIVKKTLEKGVSLEEVGIPQPREGEVLIKVKYSSICGTDLHIYLSDNWATNRIHPPLIIGHEMGGEVVELGPKVSHIKLGDRVGVETHIVNWKTRESRTGKAHLCSSTKILGVDMDGSFAEYVVLPEVNVIPNPTSIPDEFLSIEEPLGNAVHAATTVSVPGKNVLVVGSGPVGLLLIAVLKCFGTTRVFVSEINRYRLDLAQKVGADRAINPKELDLLEIIREETGGEGLDIAFDMSGNSSGINQAIKSLRPGGDMVFFGLPRMPVNINIADDIIFRGLTLHGIIGRKMFDTWYEVLDLLENKKIDLGPIITHRFPYEEIDKAMDLMDRGESGKILLFP